MDGDIRELLSLGADRWNRYRAEHPEFGADDGSCADEAYEDWVERTKNVVPIVVRVATCLTAGGPGRSIGAESGSGL